MNAVLWFKLREETKVETRKAAAYMTELKTITMMIGLLAMPLTPIVYHYAPIVWGAINV